MKKAVNDDQSAASFMQHNRGSIANYKPISRDKMLTRVFSDGGEADVALKTSVRSEELKENLGDRRADTQSDSVVEDLQLCEMKPLREDLYGIHKDMLINTINAVSPEKNKVAVDLITNIRKRSISITAREAIKALNYLDVSAGIYVDKGAEDVTNIFKDKSDSSRLGFFPTKDAVGMFPIIIKVNKGMKASLIVPRQVYESVSSRSAGVVRGDIGKDVMSSELINFEVLVEDEKADEKEAGHYGMASERVRRLV